MSFKFTNTGTPHIYVYGAGGTGGFFLENVGRLLAGNDIPSTIEVYDGDTVEAKNLKRQAFTVNDLGRNKAVAITERLTNDVDNPPNFIAHENYVTDVDEIVADVLGNTQDDEFALMVLAVDNIETRRQINAAISELADLDVPVIAIDCGNDDQAGQVVLYANYPVKDRPILGSETDLVLETMLTLFPEIDTIRDDRDRNPGLVTNCAENAESHPQAMMANKRNADVMANLVISVAQNRGFSHNIWLSNLLTGETIAKLGR